MIRPTPIPASIEVSPSQVLNGKAPAALFPQGTRVYITDVGTETHGAFVQAARLLSDAGYRPVPHIAARRFASHQELRARIGGLAQHAGVDDVLVIAGEADRQQGPFDSTLSVLETSLLDEFGITQIGIAGHPEGNPVIGEPVLASLLSAKAAFAERTGATMRIVTQFGFDPKTALAFADQTAELNLDLPIHIGVAGPAKITTLLRYAAICGVGPSVDFLKKRAGSVFALASGFDPETVVEPIAQHRVNNPKSALVQIHVFPFGGLNKSAEWLIDRGSWPERQAPYQPMQQKVSGL